MESLSFCFQISGPEPKAVCTRLLGSESLGREVRRKGSEAWAGEPIGGRGIKLTVQSDCLTLKNHLLRNHLKSQDSRRKREKNYPSTTLANWSRVFAPQSINPLNFCSVHALDKEEVFFLSHLSINRDALGQEVWGTLRGRGCCQVAPVWIQSGPGRADVHHGASNKRPQWSEMVSKQFIAEWHSWWTRKSNPAPAT